MNSREFKPDKIFFKKNMALTFLKETIFALKMTSHEKPHGRRRMSLKVVRNITQTLFLSGTFSISTSC